MQRAQVRGYRVPGIMMRLGVVTMLLLPFLVAPAHAGPRVVVDQPVFDFGELPQGQKIAHTFILKNAGDADLTIHVKPCWGVKVSAPGGPLVKPGASRTITAELTSPTGAYEGVLKKVIGIETNDPQTPLASLTITAFIYAPLQVEPRSVDLAGITAGTAPRQDLLIRNRSQDPITITQIAVNPARFATIAPPGAKSMLLKPGVAMKLVVTLSPTLPLDYNYGKVTLYTDSQKLPEKAIPIRVQVVPAKR